MLVHQGKTRINRAVSALLAGLLAVFLPTSVSAQTVLSPAPLLPIQERPNSAGEMPANAVLQNEYEDDPDTETEEKIFHIPLVLNESVEGQIEYFTTRGRTVFQAWLNRSVRYLPLMKKIFREYNLPEDLVYIAMIESGFNPHAVSEKKAVGPWQFMRPTAREYGLNTDYWVDERKDPVKSTRAAAAHLKDLYNLFRSWPMALASYNAGMGRMQGAVQKNRTDDFWELSSSLHSETQEYVPRYMAALIIAKNPPAYGFNDPSGEPIEFDEILIDKSTDLRRIAAYTGASYTQIRDLNPELLQPATPRTPYLLRVPRGTTGLYQKNIAHVSLLPDRVNEGKKTASRKMLFSRLASAFRAAVPERLSPVRIISRFSAHLDLNDVLTSRSTASRAGKNVGLP